MNLEEGDIVVFYKTESDGVPITHRVITNNKEDKTLITKGDANEHNDILPVEYGNVVGCVEFHLPVLGYLSLFLAKPIGKAVMLLILLEGYLLTVIGGRRIKQPDR